VAPREDHLLVAARPVDVAAARADVHRRDLAVGAGGGDQARDRRLHPPVEHRAGGRVHEHLRRGDRARADGVAQDVEAADRLRRARDAEG
jgi:hypothetical protein